MGHGYTTSVNMHTPTLLIQKFSQGDSAALNQLFEMVYHELHTVAKKQLSVPTAILEWRGGNLWVNPLRVATSTPMQMDPSPVQRT